MHAFVAQNYMVSHYDYDTGRFLVENLSDGLQFYVSKSEHEDELFPLEVHKVINEFKKMSGIR